MRFWWVPAWRVPPYSLHPVWTPLVMISENQEVLLGAGERGELPPQGKEWGGDQNWGQIGRAVTGNSRQLLLGCSEAVIKKPPANAGEGIFG